MHCSGHPPGGIVRDHGSGDGGRAAGPAVGVDEAAHGQVAQIMTDAIPVRARLTVAAYRSVDDVRLYPSDCLIADAELVSHPGTESLLESIGVQQEAPENLLARGAL